MLNEEEFDLICKNKGYWLGEIKTKEIKVKDVNNFGSSRIVLIGRTAELDDF